MSESRPWQDVMMHIEEVYAPHGFWPPKYAHADHVEFGWERSSNLNLLTGQTTLEEWAKEEIKEEKLELKEAAKVCAQRAQTAGEPTAQ